MISNFNASKYKIVQLLIICLSHLILKKEFVHHEDVPLSALVLAYSMATYNKSLHVMSFDIEGQKMAISKGNFYKFLGFIVGEAYSNPKLVSSANMLRDEEEGNNSYEVFVEPVLASNLIVRVTTPNMDDALNKVKDLKTLIISDNTTHNQKFIDVVNNFVTNYDTESKLDDIIVSKDAKFTSLKKELMIVQNELVKKDYEQLLVKGRNFEINQRIFKITEQKDSPYVDYILKLLGAKLQPLYSKLSVTKGVPSSGATSQ
ncbi:unnamed protein product [Lactuca saligna]|uniref:Uncharacterized protein n=1 Tax=Lactuca saligna TaxID=75948 RepID=A0AA35Y7F6_LACSI|nr:unnamed protein product [Lactuca saligna]